MPVLSNFEGKTRPMTSQNSEENLFLDRNAETNRETTSLSGKMAWVDRVAMTTKNVLSNKRKKRNIMALLLFFILN